MGRHGKITPDQWIKIVDNMERETVPVRYGNVTFLYEVWKTHLPRGTRGLSMNLGKNQSIIFYSHRLYSQPSIVEVIKHEAIHLLLGNGKHGKWFKRLCLERGLNPKNHV